MMFNVEGKQEKITENRSHSANVSKHASALSVKTSFPSFLERKFTANLAAVVQILITHHRQQMKLYIYIYICITYLSIYMCITYLYIRISLYIHIYVYIYISIYYLSENITLPDYPQVLYSSSLPIHVRQLFGLIMYGTCGAQYLVQRSKKFFSTR